jgi:formylmethanofuran dehydrogenase subunit B
MPQNACFIDGRSASLSEAARAAGALIAAARLPVFVLGSCDVAGTRAAIRLAERVGGVIDHVESANAFRELDVMRGFGKFIVTPNEARQRADTVLLIGSDLTKFWPDMVERLGLAKVPRLSLQPEQRHILWIGEEGEEESLSRLASHKITARAEALPRLIGALRACNMGRRVALSASDKNALDMIVEGLQRAKFGLVVYSPSSLGVLAIEMLSGLVADLNKSTRFSTLSVGGSGNAETSMQTAGWMTGFPVRTGFGRGFPEHDPWRFDASRLVESGEVDALVWISCDGELPSWTSRAPLVALTCASSAAADAKCHIIIGQHGRDHDGVDFARETQSLAWRRASRPSDHPSVAAVLEEIAASLPDEVAAC